MKNKILLILLSISLGFVACKKEETTNNTTTPSDNFQIPSGYIKVGEAYAIGAKAKVVVYSESSLKTGYNKLHTIVYDSASGTILKSGHLEIIPMMDMGTMQHSSPVENQESETPVNNFYESAVIFTMPSSAMSSWHLHIHFHNHATDMEGEAELDVIVANQTPARVLTSVLDKQNIDLNISPNPNKGTMLIEWKNQNGFSYELINLNGKEVLSGSASSNSIGHYSEQSCWCL